MKISKKSVLIMGGILCTVSFGLLYVSADRELFMNPSNAVQHMENVKFISTDTANDTTATLKKSIYNDFLRIETNNLILGDAGNSIESNVNNSSILGGKSNTIKMGSKDNVIIGGSENTIQPYTVGNTIIGGNNNMVSGGSYLTIIGGNHNETNGHFNTIIGGSNNKYTSGVDNSVIMGNDSSVGGNNSVALGLSSNIEANNSFLWTDGSSSDTLTNDNVFAIMASNGAIIDTDEAHSSAKLTLGKSLILSKNENQSSITCEGGKGGGIIKIEKSEDANQMCLCSCDGHGWNSVSKGSCINVCNNGTSTETESAKCGNQISRICTEQGITTYSGSCDSGNVIEGAGAYFVDKNNIVHRSCQGDDGTIASCTGSINQSQCIQVTSTFSCTNPPANAVLITGSDQNLTANTPGKLYSGVAAAGNSRCAYICDNTHIYTGYNGGTCITKSSTYSCTGTVSAYATLIPGSDQGLTGNTTRTIYPNAIAANGKKCAYLCNSETHEYKNGDCKAKPGVHECKKNPPLPEHAILWFPYIMPSNSSTPYRYSAEAPITESLKACKYRCEDGYSYDGAEQKCIENICQGTLPDNASLWYPDIKPDNYITEYSHLAAKPEGAKACTYHCNTGYTFNNLQPYKCLENAACNPTYNGRSFSNLENGNHLCEVGNASLFYERVSTNQWTWQCVNGNSRVDCSAKKQIENAACNPTYNGKTFTGETTTLKETDKLCSKGDVKGFTFNKDTHQRTRQCKNGSNKIDCSAQAAPVAYLLKGKDINKYFKKIDPQDIYRYTNKPSNKTIYKISKDTSPYDVYFREVNNYGGGLYSEAETIFMNKDSSHMFESIAHLSITDRLQKFNTDYVEDMSYMFCGSSLYHGFRIFSDAFDNFNTKNVTNMSHMFCGISNNLNLSNFDTSNVEDMSYMFNGNESTTLDLSSFNTNSVKNMSFMFNGNGLTTLDLSNFNTSSVTNMECMFLSRKLTTIFSSNTFSTNLVPPSQEVFCLTRNLRGGAGTTFDDDVEIYGKEYAKIDGGPSSPGFFRAK